MKKISETSIQYAIVDYAKRNGLGDYLLHIPNEQIIFSKRLSLPFGQKMCWIKKLKKMGLRKGASDLFIAWPQGKYYGLFLEIKNGSNCSIKSRKSLVKKEQINFLKCMMTKKYACDVVFNIEEGVITLNHYLALKSDDDFLPFFTFL